MDRFETGDGIESGDNSYKYNESAARASVTVQNRLEAPLKPIAIRCEKSQTRERLLNVFYRVFEIFFAVTLLVVAFPLLLILALMVRLDSRGPVFFGMQRTGKSRRVLGRELVNDDSVLAPAAGIDPDSHYWVPTSFKFYKFRTMHQDSAVRFPEYYWWDYELDQQKFQAMFYKVKEDPRLTRVGKWLRKTSFDELPNFWHILTGETTLVGPRPEGSRIQGFYTEEQMRKFTVKPGLTCLSKIYGRGDLPVGEQIKWDLEYVDSRNVWLDLKIVMLTVWLVLTQRGAF